MKYYSIVSLISGIEVETLYAANSYDEAMASYDKDDNMSTTSIMRFKPTESEANEAFTADKTDTVPFEENLYKVRFKRAYTDIDRLIPDKIRDNHIKAKSFEEAVLKFVSSKMKNPETECISCYDLDVQKVIQTN